MPMPKTALASLALGLAACAPLPEVESGPRTAGSLGFISDCTVLESRAARVMVPVDGNGRVLGSVGGGLAGTLLGPVGAAGGAAAGAAAGGVADRLLARVDGAEYIVRREDGAQLSVAQDLAEDERIIPAGEPCRIRTDQASGTARVLPPLPDA